MSGDLVSFPGGAPVPSSIGGFALRRDVREVERRSAVQQLHEDARMALAQLRINNGVALAGRAAIGVAELDALITTISADKPFLELELRQLQRLLGVSLASVLMNYMGGR